jgi:hypothetical protein
MTKGSTAAERQTPSTESVLTSRQAPGGTRDGRPDPRVSA